MAQESRELQNKKGSPSGISARKALAVQICAWCAASLLIADVGARVAFEEKRPQFSMPMYQQFMHSPDKPDVLVVGSSVALCASFCADETLKKLDSKDKNEYTDALFLQKQLRQKGGQDLNCRTLATAGAMASDAWMLVSKAIEFDKKPKILIYETVSRDLFDANMPQLCATPVYQTLASVHPENKNSLLPKPVVSAIDAIRSSDLVTAISLTFADARFLSDPERLQFCVDSISSALSYTYKSRTENRNWLTEKVCKLLNRKSTIYQAAQANSAQNTAGDQPAQLAAFQVDSRPQEKRYANELVFFEKLVKLCRQNSIELVVVFLPVGEGYDAKVPPTLKKRIPADALAIAKRYGVKTLDLSKNPTFTKADFADHVHLKDTGAVKLTNLVTDELLKDKMLSSRKEAERNY